MRLFKVTACIPSPEKVRSQRELQNTFFHQVGSLRELVR